MKLSSKLIVILILLTVGSMFATDNRELQISGDVINLDLPGTGEIYSPSSRQDVPAYSVATVVDLILSYYDYFPGSYGSYPIVQQPSPAGLYPGGGLYLAYMVMSSAGAIRRAYYTCIEDLEVVGGPSIIDPESISEGFPGIDVDYESGDPWVAWHGPGPDPTLFNIDATFDQFNLMGSMGFLWNTAYPIIDNQITNEEYIWPVVKVGPSPTPGMRRVYIVGSNAATVGLSAQGMNAFIAFADYFDVGDLATYSDDDWTHYTVPYMYDWALAGWKAYWDFSVSDDGDIVIAGILFDWEFYGDDTTTGQSDNDAIFVLHNSYYGEGSTEDDWDLYTDDPHIHVENPVHPVYHPNGYFTDDDGVPYPYMMITPFAPRFTIDINDLGDVVWTSTYRLSTPTANRLYVFQAHTKYVNFSFDTEEFTVTDLYPRSDNLDAQPYLPWDPEGDGNPNFDPDGNLLMTVNWGLYWWDADNFGYQSENYTRILQDGPYVVAVYQDCTKAKLFNDWDDPDYASWFDKPEIHIQISSDYGHTWSDPIIMNANPADDNYVPELDGMIPAYVYPAKELEHLGGNWVRLHLMFYDQTDYGSFIQGNGPQTGGWVSYMAVDIEAPVSVEDDYIVSDVPNRLHQNYPNPFNPNTTIRFNMPQTERVNISIYNIKGQLVKTLVDNVVSAGDHYVTWNGTDNNSREVSSGVYFYKLDTDTHAEMEKMLLVK